MSARVVDRTPPVAEAAPAASAYRPPPDGGARPGALAAWWRLLRPRQWIKNAFVVAPLVFSGLLTDPAAVAASLGAFALFCLAASGIYCWNDVLDAEADRHHPTKSRRPVAAGLVSSRAALTTAVALLLGAVALSPLVAPGLTAALVAYLVLNVVYARWLKAVVILDVFGLAGFFVLRLLAGSAAIGVVPSVWLLLCGGLLALYLGFAKRRHELVLLGTQSARHRSVLGQYDAAFLDQVSVILLGVTLVSYVMYTLVSATARAVGSETLSYSTVFVLYGVFRFLLLAHRQRAGDAAETLLTDRGLLAAVACWLLYCGWAIYRPF